jgi:GT2 family glycosyltransferase/glycosyltransferase involved in cell wall biosynthesis
MPLVHAHSTDEARQILDNVPSPVVVIPVFNGFDDVVRCYESVLAHTPSTHAVLVVDDCGADRAPIDILDKVADRLDQLVVVLHRETNGGFVRACNDAFAATPGNDVILLNSDCAVGPQWLERMSAAAASSSLVATVTALTNHGTIVSVPVRNTPDDRLPGGMEVDAAAIAVAEASLQLRPTLPTAIGHCVLIRRLALDLVGGFDEAFGTGYGEEVDFSQRALQRGLRHVCADDVLVYHRGGASFGAGATDQQQANEAIVNARYPWYRPAVVRASTDEYSPLALALDRARVALTGMSVGVDALTLGPHTTGTQVVTFETICALAHQLDGGELVVFHVPSLPAELAASIDALPGSRRVVMTDLSPPDEPMVDVIYRPCQVSTVEELRWLKAVGRRCIVNQLDIIAWSNPSYFANDEQWLQRRELTRLVLATVDGVAFLSHAAAAEVNAEGVLPSLTPRRVVWCGTDHSRALAAGSIRPRRMPGDGRPFLVAMGVSYHHKNRVFSLQVLRGLRAAGWDGRLVMAGPLPPRGNSKGLEAAELLVDRGLRDHVVDLGDVTEQEKNWLYDNASLSMYPTTTEGFGLVPFESASHGLPVLVSRQGSLNDVLPEGMESLSGYDIDQAVALANRLLTDSVAADTQCSLIRARGLELTWERTASQVLELVSEVLTQPRNRVTSIQGEREFPSGITATVFGLPRPSTIGRGFEWLVDATSHSRALKRLLSPDGSRRQDALRAFINWGRRHTGVQVNA